MIEYKKYLLKEFANMMEVFLIGIKLSEFISEGFEFTDEEIYNAHLQAGFDVELNQEFKHLQKSDSSERISNVTTTNSQRDNWQRKIKFLNLLTWLLSYVTITL